MGQYFNKFKAELKQILAQIGNLSLLKTSYKTDLVGAINELSEVFKMNEITSITHVSVNQNISGLGLQPILFNVSDENTLIGVKDGFLNKMNGELIDVSKLSPVSIINCSLACSSTNKFNIVVRMYHKKTDKTRYNEYEFSAPSFILNKIIKGTGAFSYYEAFGLFVRIFDTSTVVKLSQITISTQEH